MMPWCVVCRVDKALEDALEAQGVADAGVFGPRALPGLRPVAAPNTVVVVLGRSCGGGKDEPG